MKTGKPYIYEYHIECGLAHDIIYRGETGVGI